MFSEATVGFQIIPHLLVLWGSLQPSNGQPTVIQ